MYILCSFLKLRLPGGQFSFVSWKAPLIVYYYLLSLYLFAYCFYYLPDNTLILIISCTRTYNFKINRNCTFIIMEVYKFINMF